MKDLNISALFGLFILAWIIWKILGLIISGIWNSMNRVSDVKLLDENSSSTETVDSERIDNNNYVDISFDEFENKTTFQNEHRFGRPQFGNPPHKLRWIKALDLNRMLIDYDGVTGESDGLPRRMIISYDGQTLEMPFTQHNLDVTSGNSGSIWFNASGVYDFGSTTDLAHKELLHALCVAKDFKVRDYFEKNYINFSPKEAEICQNAMRVFFAGCFDSTEFDPIIRPYLEAKANAKVHARAFAEANAKS